MKVSFVGTGAIGLPMANRVALGGHDVTGIDPFAEARDKAGKLGIPAVATLEEAPAADVVIVMVATPAQLETLVDDAVGSVRAQTWVIMSTVGPDSIVREGERLRKAGARVVDAPVTGGTARAKTGELVIFASGDAGDIDQVSPVLGAMGTLRVGGNRLGDGQGIKVVNQHLCSVHIVAAAEALNLARSLGLDQAFVLDLIKSGAAGSWMLSDRGPRMLLGNDAPVTSTINIFVKDSGLVAGAAGSCGAEVPLLDIAKERYLTAAAQGLGQRDDSRVIETYKNRTK
ncbi:MAG: NAD(P)-dependent oxidoreductase [Telmatospirillum sp.]|nr:NAD(P)-dependent oxidoreductase [Telmatospirillum sp.]